MIKSSEIDHMKTCEEFTIACPAGCSSNDIRRKDIDQHLQTECEISTQACPLAAIGCDFKGTKNQIKKHIGKQSTVENHFMILCQAMKKQLILSKEYESALKICRMELNSAEKELTSLKREVGQRMIWKVTNWEERFQSASTNKRPCIASPPFYSCKHGYKMALSLCPYGDSDARGEFMSLYVCICKGEFDALQCD